MNDDGIADIPNGTYPAGTIYESDIVFNGSYNFQNTGGDGTIDIQSIALHEIGHVIGLSHSTLDNSVMYPTLQNNIATARELKADDIAYASFSYPEEPLYNASFGSISGKITNGSNKQPILGGHVYAVDPATGNKMVGAYSYQQGDFIIPGLVSGQYYIGIEPLDGEPKEADPSRINQIIANTNDINFVEEFYDTNESEIESSPGNAQIITVSAGDIINDINLITNTSTVPGVSIRLQSGLNLFSYPVETSAAFTAFDLLRALGDESQVNSIDQYNTKTGQYERATWSSNTPDGINFIIERGKGYLVHMQQQKLINFKGTRNCPLVDLEKGFNLIGVPCPSAGYSAYDLLNSIGPSVKRVKAYNPNSAQYEEASFDNEGQPTGTDFIISNGNGYIIETLAEQKNILLPRANQIFPPYISGISPGRGFIGAEVLITGQGFALDKEQNEVLFNNVRAAVKFASIDALVVVVPGIATSGPVVISTAGKTSNNVPFIVESSVVTENSIQGIDLLDGQTVQGNLDTGDEQDRYSFIATKGTWLTAHASSLNPGNPDLMLFLEGPSGEILTSDNNNGGGTDAKIHRYELPRSGRYSLVVSSVPGSGSGAYTLTMNLENIKPVKEIIILNGDSQTGLQGTTLEKTLEIMVTSASGKEISGLPISFVTNNDVQVSSTGFTAAELGATTNSSGLATIRMSLPNVEGQFTIAIQIPGYEAKTIEARSVPSLPAVVEKEGDNQNCDQNNDGCPVGEELPEYYRLTFLNNIGQPVRNVGVTFEVVSGGGTLNGNNVVRFETQTNDQGVAQVKHTLGTKLFERNSNKLMPQIVVASGTIPGTEAIIFQTLAQAGPAIKIQSLRTDTVRMTMGTAELVAIELKVTDKFGNPVINQIVDITSESPIIAIPSFLENEGTTEFKTDIDGKVSAGLVAFFKDYSLDSRNVEPTINEVGNRIGNKNPYIMNISTSGSSGSITREIMVDVDMGPKLITITHIQGEEVGAQPGSVGWIGSELKKPVVMMVMGFHRHDTCAIAVDDLVLDDPSLMSYNKAFNDYDSGSWMGEPFTMNLIKRYSRGLVPVTFTIKRIDENGGDASFVSNSSVLTYPNATWPEWSTWPTGYNSMKVTKLESRSNFRNVFSIFDGTYVMPDEGAEWINNFALIEPKSVFTKPALIEIVPKFDSAQGGVVIEASIDRHFTLYADPLCTARGVLPEQMEDGNYLFLGRPWSQYTWPTADGEANGILQLHRFRSIDIPRASAKNTFLLRSVSPRVEVILTEQTFENPNPDPLPSSVGHSGLDLSNVTIILNSTTTIFSGIENIPELNVYPNYIKAYADNIELDSLDAEIIEALAPKEFKLVYFPIASEVTFDGENRVEVSNNMDKNTNTEPAQITTFILPSLD